jgi:hypothetical protein
MRRQAVRTLTLLAALAPLLCAPTAAWPATPRPDLGYEAHQHDTGGHDWHVQMETNKAGNRLSTLVVYSQACHDTGFAQRIKIDADGAFSSDKRTASKKGRWAVTAQFKNQDTVVGTWKVIRGDCTDGGDFTAVDRGHFILGNPFEYAPERIYGTAPGARAARHLKNASLRTARDFDTLRKARAHGYEFGPHLGRCPGLHHARKHGTSMWGRLLDAHTPQSLVFWCDARRRWTLAAYMYRAPARPRPKTFGNLIQWHRHGDHAYTTWMTHVWLVKSPVAAWATCAPFAAFEAEGMFEYEPMKFSEGHSSAPCSDTDKT